MEVREATSEDFDGIARLTIAAYRALDRWVGDEYAVHLADVAARANAVNTWVLVADDGEAGLAGTVTLTIGGGPFFNWDLERDGDCGFRMLAVDPATQGRGVAARLVSECVARATAAGARRMIIGSADWMTTAHRIYERLGFYRVPELDPTWGDMCGFCFRKELEP